MKKQGELFTESQSEEMEGEEKRTFSLPVSLCEKLEQEAYWKRITQKDILVRLLKEYYEGKKLKPLPKDYKKPLRGPKPKQKERPE